jgi:putative mRNA 3-end processing factor
MTLIGVRSDGCVHLGGNVTCDGFSVDASVRVQTHVHEDHMRDFERSKGQQKIVCSEGTYDLLLAEKNADLPYRSNILIQNSLGKPVRYNEDSMVELYDSGHMLGGVCVVVDAKNNGRFMYTSDFNWPLRLVPEDVNVLVVDATYGDPSQIRNYRESQVLSDFLEVFQDAWTKGSVVLTGHRGRIHAVMRLLTDIVSGPFVLSSKMSLSHKVYEKHYGISGEFFGYGSAEHQSLQKSGTKYVSLIDSRDMSAMNSEQEGTRILLSCYMVPKKEPILVHTNGLIRVAITDHADFTSTIKLIESVSPSTVIADNSKGGNADALADFVKNELGIDASANVIQKQRGWGR